MLSWLNPRKAASFHKLPLFIVPWQVNFYSIAACLICLREGSPVWEAGPFLSKVNRGATSQNSCHFCFVNWKEALVLAMFYRLGRGPTEIGENGGSGSICSSQWDSERVCLPQALVPDCWLCISGPYPEFLTSLAQDRAIKFAFLTSFLVKPMMLTLGTSFLMACSVYSF